MGYAVGGQLRGRFEKGERIRSALVEDGGLLDFGETHGAAIGEAARGDEHGHEFAN